MKGWFRDNYRHSLAARRISMDMALIMNKRTEPKMIEYEMVPDWLRWQIMSSRIKTTDPKKSYPSEMISDVDVATMLRKDLVAQANNKRKEIKEGKGEEHEQEVVDEYLNPPRKSLAVNDPYDNWRYPKDVFGKREEIEDYFGLPLEEIPKYEVIDYLEDNRQSFAARNIIKESFNEWIMKPKKNACNEKLIGGVADCMPDDQFAEPELSEGITVEMEHTHDPDVAKEISKDHIMETGVDENGKFNSRYYEKLREMENEL
jgi:hypothetical protein